MVSPCCLSFLTVWEPGPQMSATERECQTEAVTHDTEHHSAVLCWSQQSRLSGLKGRENRGGWGSGRASVMGNIALALLKNTACHTCSEICPVQRRYQSPPTVRTHTWSPLDCTGGKHKARRRIRLLPLFYPAWHFVSTRRQCRALA